MPQEEQMLSKSEFWQKAAAFTFGLWAIMLPIAAGLVISSVGRFTDRFDAYVLAMEKRVTLLEERQARVLQILEQHNRRLDGHEDRMDTMDGRVPNGGVKR